MMFFSRMTSPSRRSREHVPVDRPAHLPLVGVEGRRDVEAVIGEDRRVRDRLAEPAGAEERDVVLALRPEDLPDLAREPVDVVADAALAELPEPGEVAPDLGRVDVRVLADLLRGDPLLAHLLRLRQDPQVLAEPGRDADRKAVVTDPLGLRGEGCDSRGHPRREHSRTVFPTRRVTVKRSCRRRPESVRVDVVREGLAAVDREHRNPLPVALLELRVARDVHRLELERDLLAHARDDAQGRLAEVAAVRDVDGDRDCYG